MMSYIRSVAAIGASLSFAFATAAHAQSVSFNSQQQALADLGKQVFFDESMSTPGNKQGCVSCHAPERGWTFPDSEVNEGPVGNPGAKKHDRGKIKPPTVAYGSFVRHFQPCTIGNPIGGRWCGGLFWDGRAEGTEPFGNWPVGDGGVSESVSWEELQLDNVYFPDYSIFLGPLTDQALNPAVRPGIEQNAGEKKVCQRVKTAKYKALYKQAFGERINCKNQPEDNPAYRVAFKRIALSLSAYQASSDVNSFSSIRDLALYRELACAEGPGGVFDEYYDGALCTDLALVKAPANYGEFPLAFIGFGLPADQIRQINRGHDLFYGVASEAGPLNDGNPLNESGELRGPEEGPLGTGPEEFAGVGTDVECWQCHSDNPGADDGAEPRQTYMDQAYHNIGIPFNREIPDTIKGEVAGIVAHISFKSPLAPPPPFFTPAPGAFRTPTLRENGKGEEPGFVKAFGHNGYFKSLESLIHFYGTRELKQKCEDLGITDATEVEAVVNDCWPVPEFPFFAATFGRVGISDMYPEEEAALVAYIRALTDTHVAEAP